MRGCLRSYMYTYIPEYKCLFMPPNTFSITALLASQFQRQENAHLSREGPRVPTEPPPAAPRARARQSAVRWLAIVRVMGQCQSGDDR